MAELLAANQITIAKVLDGEKGEKGDKGDKGDKGEQGIPGIGTDGKTSYLHIAYATSADGSEGFSVTESANKTYIGQYTDFVASDSTDYTKYSWTKIKGEMSAEQLAQLNQASEDAANAQTDINTLSDKTRSGHIETLSGSGFVQSTKTEDGGTTEVVVYGKSNQKVTQQSANLCPTYDKWTLSGGAYIDGDYIVFPSNGATAVVDVHWKKASNIAYFYINCKRDGDDAATLLISSSNGNDRAKVLQTDETTYNGIFGGNNVYGDTLLAMEYVRLTLKHYQTTTGSMRIKNFMVSSTNTPYVPFVPDSPSPEYPSEIQSVKNPKVTACGKNLLKHNTTGQTKAGITYTVNKDGSVTLNGTSTALTFFNLNYIAGERLPRGSYIVSGGNEKARLQILINDAVVANDLGNGATFAVGDNATTTWLRIVIYANQTFENETIYPMIRSANVEDSGYEPYKGKTATLSGIVLMSIPDGTRDKLFKDTDGLWKVDRKCGVVDLGTLTWEYNSTYAVFTASVNAYTSFPTAGPNNMGVCSKYLVHGSVVVSELVNYDDTIFICPYNWSSKKWLLVRDTSYTDATTFKSAMSGAMLVYELAIPTYETLPDSIQAELNALTTYNPITNVMVSDGITPDIDVSFWTRDYYAKNAAENAAKVATNFLGYDSTNGLIIGNKASGAWSGYRSQILPDSFNILDESSTVLASFGTTTVIGEEAKANMHLTFNNLSMVDKNGAKFFEVGDARNADGIATIKHTAKVTVSSAGSATVTVNSNISSIVSVYADSVQLSSSSYSFSQKDVTINNLTANSQTSIEITYTTTESTVYLTFGERDSSGNIGNYSVAEGYGITASGYCSHAEGNMTTASGLDSHAEGYMTKASGSYSHAEGYMTKASGRYSHAEGEWTEAIDSHSHAEGYNTTASGSDSHAEGRATTASGHGSHAGGHMTVADGMFMTAIGEYNTKHSGKAFVIGNGTSDNDRRDIFTVGWAGNVDIADNIYMELGDCYIRDSGTTLSVTDGASTLDGLLAQAIIDAFSYAEAIEILGEEITGRNANLNVKKLLQKIVEKLKR